MVTEFAGDGESGDRQAEECHDDRVSVNFSGQARGMPGRIFGKYRDGQQTEGPESK